MLIDAKAMEGIPDRQGVQWRDTLYVCVADSSYEADVLSFSIRIYRPNDDWNKDKVLGDFDFYFSYSSKAFDPAATPIIERCIEGMDNGSAVRNNLVYVYTQFMPAASVFAVVQIIRMGRFTRFQPDNGSNCVG